MGHFGKMPVITAAGPAFFWVSLDSPKPAGTNAFRSVKYITKTAPEGAVRSGFTD